jgi:prepilin-type N-terminal cleavage/methylation domain-containing protein
MRSRGAPDAAGDERGFTLVELVIALMVLAVVMVALAPAFYGNLKAAGATSYRSTATGLAVAAIEQMRGFPYFEVGYASSTQDSWCQSSGAGSLPWNNESGLTSVDNVTGTDPQTSQPYSVFENPNNHLATSQKVGPITYSIYRCVYWVPSSTAGPTGTAGLAGAYKLSWVGVQWNASGISWHVTQTSAIYPGGENKYVAADSNGIPFTPNCQNHGSVPGAPVGLAATVDPTFPTTAIDLTWSEATGDPVSALPIQYEVDYQTTGSGQWVFYQDTFVPGTANNPFVVDGLVPGTSYSFELYEVACDSTYSAATSAVSLTTSGSSSTTTTTASTTTTTVPSTTTTTVAGSTTTSTSSTSTTTTSVPPGCGLSNFAVSPASGAAINSSGSLTGNQKYFLISVDATLGCSGLAVEYTPTNNGQVWTDAYTGAATTGTLTWQTTATTWAEGTVVFNLFVAGQSAGWSQSVLIACANGKNC